MKALLNTNLFGIINVGMYYSQISPETIFDDWQINDDQKEGYINYNSDQFWYNFNNDLYIKEVQKIASSFLNGLQSANNIDIEIKCGVIYSPKFYNFATDNLEFYVKFDKRKVLKFAKDNKDTFNQFLKDNYSSRDGFHSFTANNFNYWLDDFKINNVQSIGAILTFIFKDEFEDLQNDFVTECYENLFYSNFTTLE